MPDARLDRTRRNYSRETPCTICGSVECTHVQADRGHAFHWRRPSETQAEQLARRAALIDPGFGFTANVIEGDPD